MNRITSRRQQLGRHDYLLLRVDLLRPGPGAGRWFGLDRQLCLFGYLRKKSGKILTGAKDTGARKCRSWINNKEKRDWR